MVSIIIPAHNPSSMLDACLSAVLEQAVPTDRYEIIVVDDGSTPPLAVSDPRLRVVRRTRGGAAAARNVGLKHARGEIVIFLDADCVPAPGWLTAMLAPFDDEAVTGVSGRVDTLQAEVLPRFIQYEYDQRFQRLAQAQDIDFITSATGAYRRQALVDVGGYCEALWGAEDVELSFRLSELGHRLRYVPDAVVYHAHPTSLRAYAWRKRHYAFWRAEVYRRHKGKIIADSRTPQTQKLQIITLGLVAVLLFGALLWPALWSLVLLLAVFYALLLTPAVVYMLRRDLLIGLLSPLFLTTSSLAAALGILQSLVTHWRGHESVDDGAK
ncbi:MAG: glycosyltransferase [Chloroflexi bacterium]|nr:MAG: glycosyltransferase [Chloroflexota bacterium]